jgi:hypothetical protein
MKLFSWIIFLLLAFLPSIVLALEVAPGEYDLPAIVIPSSSGPVAVFNMRSLKECRIHLIGKIADNLKLEHAKGLRLKIRIEKWNNPNQGQGTLLSTRELGDSTIPLHVGDNFKVEN